jgi:hypothetical protein
MEPSSGVVRLSSAHLEPSSPFAPHFDNSEYENESAEKDKRRRKPEPSPNWRGRPAAKRGRAGTVIASPSEVEIYRKANDEQPKYQQYTAGNEEENRRAAHVFTHL